MQKIELIFIPSPGLSHLVSTVETAKLLLDRHHRLFITVLIMKLPTDQTVDDKYTQNISSSDPNTTSRLRFHHLPNQDFTSSSSSRTFMFDFINTRATHVREVVSSRINHSPDPNSRLAGLVVDMFCTKFIDVGDEFDLPSYVFFTSGAASLGLFNFLVSLKYEHGEDLTLYKNSDVELPVPCFSNPLPAKVLPAVFVEEGRDPSVFLSHFKRLADARGIMVNTFYELEPFAVQSLLSDGKSPRVYPVGPILNLNGNNNNSKNQIKDDEIKNWLDQQPESTVVFLCFGTMGSFEPAQVREIASALENDGKRFLWSLRKPGDKGAVTYPTEYEDFREVLPEGFLDRTEGIGKVVGWTNQVAVLSHPAVGCFVSHCGWNSTLESVWFGVPMATFPLYAEQQTNAFLLVRELEMAEAIRIDYVKDSSSSEIVGSEEIEEAIRRVMAEEGRSGVREKVKEMGKKSRLALMEGGSSYKAQGDFIEDVLRNIGF